MELKKVTEFVGMLYGLLVFIATALKQNPIGLEEVADGIWSIYFCAVLLGRIDERDYIIRA